MALTIKSFERNGNELLLHFHTEDDAIRAERAIAAYGADEEPVAQPVAEPVPEAAQAGKLLPIRVHEKSKWDDGMVLEAWVTNTTGTEQHLSIGLVMDGFIEEVWGGTRDVDDDGEYVIESDKPIKPGEEWKFTLKAKGVDHSYEFIGVEQVQDKPESADQSPEPAQPVAEAAPSTDAPGTLVYAPAIDPGKSAEDNILDNLGGVYDGGWEWVDTRDFRIYTL